MAHLRADRDPQPAAHRELLVQGFWDFGPSGRHDDGVEGRPLGSTVCLVVAAHLEVLVALLCEASFCALCESGISLDVGVGVGVGERMRIE